MLIGGPPCQAYSLVGRARNRGIVGYRAEDDERYRLYQHYRNLVAEFAPAAFVMENVKAVSAQDRGASVFEEIIESLQSPGGPRGPSYRLVPLVLPEAGIDEGVGIAKLHPSSRNPGVPQARHRVIILGVRSDYGIGEGKFLQPSDDRCTVAEAIGGLPPLRSGLRIDGKEAVVADWARLASRLLRETAARAKGDREVAGYLRDLASEAAMSGDPGRGDLRQSRTFGCDDVLDHIKAGF